MNTTVPSSKATDLAPLSKGRLVYVAPAELIPHPDNPRKHSRSQILGIAKSMELNGYTAPVVVDKHMTVLAGHGRREAALFLGLATIPVIVHDCLTDEQAKAYMLADNKLTDRSTWDDPKAAKILKELSESPVRIDLSSTGFEQPEIDFRIQSLEPPDSADVVDDFVVAAAPATSSLGMIWQLGHHRIICGDARDTVALAAVFAGHKATAAFSDPPYNVRIAGHVGGKGAIHHREFPMASGEMTENEFIDFQKSSLSGICTFTTLGAVIYVCADWRHMFETLFAVRSCDCKLLNVCVWIKSNAGMGSFYRSHHEMIFVLRNGPAPYLNNVQLGKFGRHRTNVWNYSGANAFARKGSRRNLELHPTVKPVLMVADAIMDCTTRNDIVFDPFLGSGTTLIAAERTSRRCYGVELDPIYVDTAVERWQRMTGRKAHNEFGETYDFLKSRRRPVDG